MPHPCSFIGTFLTLAAGILLIFAHISQISTSQKVPRSLRLATVDTSGLAATVGATNGLFASGARTGDNQGLRNFYEWGIWAYCASSETSNTADYCSGNSFGAEFRPAAVLLSDVPATFQNQVNSVIGDNTFVAQNYTGTFTKIAFWLLFIGACLTGVSLILTLLASRVSYVLGALIAFLAFAAIAAGAAIWTVIIAKIRNAVNGGGSGLYVSYGNAIWISWGAAAALLFAVVPLFIACCTGRNRRGRDDDGDYYDSGASAYGGTQYGGASVYRGASQRSSAARSQRGSKYDSQSIRY